MKTLLFFSLILILFSCSDSASKVELKQETISKENLNLSGVINGLNIDSSYTDSIFQFKERTALLSSEIEIKTHQGKISKINFTVSFNSDEDKDLYKSQLVKHYQKLFGGYTSSEKLHCWISNYRKQKRLQILLMDISNEENYKLEVIAGPRAQL